MATLPTAYPQLTLGVHVARWMAQYLRQPNGPLAGQRFRPTDGQQDFLLHWYALDEEGRWIYRHGVRRLAKGSGKSPFAAAMALAEFCGPVRLKDFDPTQPGGTVAKTVAMPLVQIAATAESQTANTMRMVRAFATKGSKVQTAYGIDVGKTIFYKADGGELQILTSSASAQEGAEPTFIVMDETEHWLPSGGGDKLMGTLERNLKKSSSRGLETANAWQPGQDSVAEATYEAWRAEQEGRVQEGVPPILYDARIAPPETDLADEASLVAAIEYVYRDCPWVDKLTIRNAVWDPRTSEDVSRRFYLNQPTASDDAWTTPMAWAALARPERKVADGEDIVMFFDGSKTRDATALVGCCMSDGHVFLIDAWEPKGAHHGEVEEVPAAAVDAAVDRAHDRWNIVGFFGDVREWESFVKLSWPERHAKGYLVKAQTGGKDPQPIAWDMRSRTFEFTKACELVEAEIIEASFTHDGSALLARHVGNAHRYPNRHGVSISKESKDSSKKIDAAVCMIGARMVRQQVIATGKWPRKRRGNGRVIVMD